MSLLPQNRRSTALERYGINLPVTDLSFPGISLKKGLPLRPPEGTKALETWDVFRMPIGSILVVLEGGRTYLAELTNRTPDHHSSDDGPRLFELTFSNHEVVSYDSLFFPHTETKFRTASPDEVTLWKTRPVAKRSLPDLRKERMPKISLEIVRPRVPRQH